MIVNQHAVFWGLRRAALRYSEWCTDGAGVSLPTNLPNARHMHATAGTHHALPRMHVPRLLLAPRTCCRPRGTGTIDV